MAYIISVALGESVTILCGMGWDFVFEGISFLEQEFNNKQIASKVLVIERGGQKRRSVFAEVIKTFILPQIPDSIYRLLVLFLL